jgi:hypothetical protein
MQLFKNRRGQILVEYLLLMVIAVGLATLMTKQLVNRSETKPGIIINAWNKILVNIGKDIPDCAKPDCQP